MDPMLPVKRVTVNATRALKAIRKEVANQSVRRDREGESIKYEILSIFINRFAWTDPCKNKRCGRNAKCTDGVCQCPPGFTGDPNRECMSSGEKMHGPACLFQNTSSKLYAYIPSAEACRRIRCGQNAECQDGKCKCLDGFTGDPTRGCQAPGKHWTTVFARPLLYVLRLNPKLHL